MASLYLTISNQIKQIFKFLSVLPGPFDFLRDLGDRLRGRRVTRGLTQEQLGEQCGLHRTFLGSVERGERNLSILNLRRIAKTQRVPLAELFSASQPSRPNLANSMTRRRGGSAAARHSPGRS